MKDFRDKVAVVTGAASGIGRALAEHCARERMKVVLADVEVAALRKAAEELTAQGAVVLSQQTDVSKRTEVELLAQRTLETFGAVHMLFNNAGVVGGPSIWESTWEDWEWVIGVNLWGVIHGVKVFTPIMLAQDADCHITNTASVAGLVTTNPFGGYVVTKHAVVALTEHLYRSLAQRSAKVGASVLCPGFVNTRIMDWERNRPPSLKSPSTIVSAEHQADIQRYRESMATAMPPLELAEHVFAAIRERRFYILTHPEHTSRIQTRMESIVQGRNPE